METLEWPIGASKPEFMVRAYGKTTGERASRVREACSFELWTSLFEGDCVLLFQTHGDLMRGPRLGQLAPWKILLLTNIFRRNLRMKYTGLLYCLLHSCEAWSLHGDLFKRLRSFHNKCARSICRVNLHHILRHHITSASLFRRSGILGIGIYFHNRILRWTGWDIAFSIDWLFPLCLWDILSRLD